MNHERNMDMGNFGKKMIGFGILGAAAGAAVYYFQKKKRKILICRKNSQISRTMSKRLRLPQ